MVRVLVEEAAELVDLLLRQRGVVLQLDPPVLERVDEVPDRLRGGRRAVDSRRPRESDRGLPEVGGLCGRSPSARGGMWVASLDHRVLQHAARGLGGRHQVGGRLGRRVDAQPLKLSLGADRPPMLATLSPPPATTAMATAAIAANASTAAHHDRVHAPAARLFACSVCSRASRSARRCSFSSFLLATGTHIIQRSLDSCVA